MIQEIITICIGGCGIKLGGAFWELLCLEHNIDVTGLAINPEKLQTQTSNDEKFTSFFSKTTDDTYKPRCLFVDLEPEELDEIRTGTYRALFHPNQLISGKENAASNYARGYYNLGKEKINLVMDRIKTLTDQCSNLQGFIIMHSSSGGTGSGLTSLILERLSADYPGKSKISFSVFPKFNDGNSAFTSAYNSIFSINSLIKHTNLSFIIDNSATYDICRRNLDIEKPTYTNLNRLTAQAMSFATLGLRFNGLINQNLKELETNLTYDPRLHFINISYAPIISAEKINYIPLSITEITNSAFKSNSSFTQYNPTEGKYIIANLIYRGNTTQQEVEQTITNFTNNSSIQFVSQTPTSIKTDLFSSASPIMVAGGDLAKIEVAALLLSNNTAISEFFSKITQKFDLMYSVKAFVHHYLREGMEEDEFSQARENLAALEQEYKNISIN